MVSLVAALVLSSAGPIDVFLVRNVDTTPERAADLLNRVAAALTARHLDVRVPSGVDSLRCAAKRPCVRELGVTLGSKLVVSIDVGHVTGQMAVSLEAIDVSSGERVAGHAFVLTSVGYPAGLDAPLALFVRAVHLAVPAEDAPVAVALTPAPAPVIVEPAARPVGPFVLAAAAVGGAIASGVLLGLAASSARQIEAAKVMHSGVPASTLTREQAQQLADQANARYLGAGISGGAALALAVAALLWWELAQ